MFKVNAGQLRAAAERYKTATTKFNTAYEQIKSGLDAAAAGWNDAQKEEYLGKKQAVDKNLAEIAETLSKNMEYLNTAADTGESIASSVSKDIAQIYQGA